MVGNVQRIKILIQPRHARRQRQNKTLRRNVRFTHRGFLHEIRRKRRQRRPRRLIRQPAERLCQKGLGFRLVHIAGNSCRQIVFAHKGTQIRPDVFGRYRRQRLVAGDVLPPVRMGTVKFRPDQLAELLLRILPSLLPQHGQLPPRQFHILLLQMRLIHHRPQNFQRLLFKLFDKAERKLQLVSRRRNAELNAFFFHQLAQLPAFKPPRPVQQNAFRQQRDARLRLVGAPGFCKPERYRRQRHAVLFHQIPLHLAAQSADFLHFAFERPPAEFGLRQNPLHIQRRLVPNRITGRINRRPGRCGNHQHACQHPKPAPYPNPGSHPEFHPRHSLFSRPGQHIKTFLPAVLFPVAPHCLTCSRLFRPFFPPASPLPAPGKPEPLPMPPECLKPLPPAPPHQSS